MNTEIQELINIIAENPTLPIFPVIHNSFVDWFDDNPFVDYTVGKIYNAKINKYCIYTLNGQKQFATFHDKEYLKYEHPETTFEWKEAIFFSVRYDENILK